MSDKETEQKLLDLFKLSDKETGQKLLDLPKMSDEEAGHQYRLLQAQRMLDLFKEANGRPAETTDELTAWWISPAGRRAKAYDLDPEGKIIPDIS
jgi:hypothetical protein